MNNKQDNRTHVEDVKELDKVLLPSGDFVLISLRENESDEWVSFTLFDHLPLDLCHGSAIETSVSGPLGVRSAGYYSRSQISNRIEDKLVEFFQLPSIQSRVERFAHFTAILPKLDVVLIVGHSVLDESWKRSAVRLRRTEEKVPESW